ncbi:MAG: pilus assembly protein [Gammaproteobacteria bacterium]|nr:pilus assembly protein [Gammaproteobacteria bacterium]
MLERAHITTQYPGGTALQQGSALIIALVFLLAMTLIGTTAMQGTSQQERMAGNYWDRNLAFQAAEAALMVGRQNVDGISPSPPAATDPWDQGTTWWQTPLPPPPSLCQPDVQPCPLTTSYQDLANPPRYFVQNLGAAGATQGSAAAGAITFTKCQITSRADGGTSSAVVILVETVECAPL